MSSAIHRTPPPPPPPPPPTPLPRPTRPPGSSTTQSSLILQQSDNRSNNSLSNHSSTVIEHQQSTITIRSATISSDLIRLLITPEMTHDDLAHCIAHAALSPPQTMKLLETWSTEEGDGNWTRIAGLFREKDNIFIPISLILQSPSQYTEDIFRISRQVESVGMKNKPSNKISGSIISVKALLLIIIVGLSSAFLMTMDYDLILDYLSIIMTGVSNLPTLLVDTIINHPLKDLYRHGPSVIGWEGASLPSICTQITHMGDESFWLKNIDECEKIYINKESAMLHVRKPVLYIVLIVCVFFAAQSLLKTWAIRNQNRPTREMIETYEAYRLVTKVLRRAITPSRNVHQR